MLKLLVLLSLLSAFPAQAEIYRWRDARGTVHYTNSEYEIPARYRNRAVLLNLGLPPAAGQAAPRTPGVVPQSGMPRPVTPPSAVQQPATAMPLPVPAGRPAMPAPQPPVRKRPPRQQPDDE